MVWLDGTLYPTSRVEFDVADRGFLLGDGVFDTSLVLGGKMVWRQAHVARLVAAAAALGFTVDVARIQTAIDAVLEQTTHGTLRITVTRGAGPRGLAPPVDPKPTILAAVTPLRPQALFAPLKLHPTAIRRNDTSPTARIKSLNYLDGVLASREALAAGCDDALFCDTRGRIACTSVGNIFVLIGETLVTPHSDAGVVPGIARGVLLNTCDDLGLEPVERVVTADDLDRADEVLVTNSLRLVAPVRAIGRKVRVTAGARAEALIAHMARRVRAETGVDPRELAEG